jgi:hypothetical protein
VVQSVAAAAPAAEPTASSRGRLSRTVKTKAAAVAATASGTNLEIVVLGKDGVARTDIRVLFVVATTQTDLVSVLKKHLGWMRYAHMPELVKCGWIRRSQAGKIGDANAQPAVRKRQKAAQQPAVRKRQKAAQQPAASEDEHEEEEDEQEEPPKRARKKN